MLGTVQIRCDTEPHRKGRFDAHRHGKAGIDLISLESTGADWSRRRRASKQRQRVDKAMSCIHWLRKAKALHSSAQLGSAAASHGYAKQGQIRRAQDKHRQHKRGNGCAHISTEMTWQCKSGH